MSTSPTNKTLDFSFSLHSLATDGFSRWFPCDGLGTASNRSVIGPPEGLAMRFLNREAGLSRVNLDR